MNQKNKPFGLLLYCVIGAAVSAIVFGCATQAHSRHSIRNLGTGFYETYTNPVDSPLPKPTGPFAVGRVERLLTDTGRNIAYRTQTNGVLMTTIWYPAGNVGDRKPAPYVNPREMTAWVELFSEYGYHWSAAQITRLTNSSSYAFADAPMCSHARKFPVIFYVHGQVGLRTDNSGSAEELASHGFVVVSSCHGGTAGMELPDGTLVRPQTDFHLSGNDTNPIAVAVFQDQTRDLQFLLDELRQLNARDAAFARRLDLEHVGVFGFSYGGASAAEFCNVDKRCKAGVALDPGGHPDLSKLHLQQPFMVLTGDHGVAGGSRRMFEQLTKDAYFIKIQGASHAEFSDAAEFFQSRGTGPHQALVRKYLVAFFTKYLGNASGQALENSPAKPPDIEEFVRK